MTHLVPSATNDVPCAFNSIDVGIAVGSACATAADLRLDTRVMYSAGPFDNGYFNDIGSFGFRSSSGCRHHLSGGSQNSIFAIGRKMEGAVFDTDEVSSLLGENFVVIELMVDDKRPLEMPFTVGGAPHMPGSR